MVGRELVLSDYLNPTNWKNLGQFQQYRQIQYQLSNMDISEKTQESQIKNPLHQLHQSHKSDLQKLHFHDQQMQYQQDSSFASQTTSLINKPPGEKFYQEIQNISNTTSNHYPQSPQDFTKDKNQKIYLEKQREDILDGQTHEQGKAGVQQNQRIISETGLSQLLHEYNGSSSKTKKKNEKVVMKTEGDPVQSSKQKTINKKKQEQELLARQSPIKTQMERKKQIKSWNQKPQQIRKKRQQVEAIIHKKLQQEYQLLQEKHKNKQHQQKLAKRNNILQNIQKSEQRRRSIQEQRKNLEKESVNRMMDHYNKKNTIPLYQKMEKVYQNKLIKDQEMIHHKILQRKKQMSQNLQEIKRHEFEYMKHIKNRGSHSSHKSLSENSDPKKSEFNLYGKQSSIEKQKNIEKYLRMKKFEERLRQRPVIIDQEKMKQMLITQDKHKNPLKYNYLSSVAALSDQKIYDEFKHFQICLDSKQIGNNYMRDANKESRVAPFSRVSKSVEHLQKVSSKIDYKNYLPQIKHLLKSPKKIESQEAKSEIQQIITAFASNGERVNQLNKKSQEYEGAAINSIMKLKIGEQYDKVIKAEQNIDNNYINALKMKIASAELLH